MQPSDITLDHLLNNDSFIAWVVSNGEQDSEYWNGIKETLDDKTAAILDKAANIIEKIQLLYTDREESKITTEFIQQQYIKLLEAQNSNPHIERRKVFTIQTVLKYAAILILLLTVSGIYYFTIDRDNAFEDHLTATTFNEKDILIETPDHEFFAINDETKNNWLTEKGVFVSVDGEQIKFVASDAVKDSQEQFKVHTPIGKRYHVVLTDGTKIELNSNSVLTFGLSNLGNQRNASLIGEAFFDVTHNERSPFTVHSSDLRIKVLGTEFNISNYPENGYTSATLIEGSVEVRNSMNESVVIKPGTQAKIYPGQKNIEVKTVDVQEVVAWTSGRMIFNNEKFIDLVPRLNRWYGANFVLSDKELNNVRFTGTLKKENDLTHFLQMLKYTEGISYEISDDQVKLFINK
jgi:ferric-dicitrate binding protein FerR (iron transport regulator)